ncbi:glycosyltransferase [Candidatus Pseudothioglobus singularis]|jgi:glycosyltransferase involved in cell wall biosynthesis|nr:glycosyltransferase [Candidatus Pseudothioglobus singularis]
MKQKPLVSIIMNCFNGEKYLKHAVNSVLAQSYTNWEIIFWDNQSTDRSASIFNNYDDSRLRYFYAPTHTLLYDARNWAIQESNGEFLAFLDVDDWWLPEKLEKQIILFEDEEVGLVCSNYQIVNESKNKNWTAFNYPLPTGWVLNQILKKYYVGLLTLVIRKSAVDKLPYICNPDYNLIGDFDLVTRLLSKYKLDCVQESLAFYRIHGSNESSKNQELHILEISRWIESSSSNKEISILSNFNCVIEPYIYSQAIHKLINHDRKKSYELFAGLSWGVFKIRLFFAMFLPVFVLKKIKN